LPLTREQIGLLIEAARADWTQVEPAIFGTLLERALDPRERHALGAHYTPRVYVERLVLPTVIEPLRESWRFVQAAALVLANEGKGKEAVAELRAFHRRLCELKVLDPACGSGNFLYVTLEHMKRLEGEVLNQLQEFGHGQAMLETEGFSVDPHQFLGLEINPRAAAIAELVLWIGYLQWHFRTRGAGLPPSPILKDFHNIECRDAVLAHDGVEFVTDERGVPLSRWDGRTMKKHPVTGEGVPDETARLPIERHRNPRPAQWPEADVVVGNPPFIGASTMRQALGDGYVEALRSVWKEVPDSADFVMFWWHHAGALVRAGRLSRFGFITPNSLRQTFNRRVLEAHLAGGGGAVPASSGRERIPPPEPPRPLHLAFAVPDHPWVDSADGAAVRIAMTVGAAGEGEGRLLTVTDEGAPEGDAVHVEFAERRGSIHADLSAGANVAGAVALRANAGISSPGVKLHGAGFIVKPEEAEALGNPDVIHDYRNGRDLTDKPRGVKVIDLFGLTDEEVRDRYPAVYQWVLERVKPERDQNNRATYRENWWIFGEPRRDLRPMLAGLPRYIATVETSKHRNFQFLDASIRADNMLIVVASDAPWHLGILSSRIHVTWALAAGGTLEDRPRYNKSVCFETFPFPTATPEQQARIGALAEALDAHRKRVLADHADLTLTGLYNVLEKLRAGATLTAKERTVHDKGLVGVLKSLHDDLDAAVLEAYGWADLQGPLAAGRDIAEPLLERLVALNAERAAEEAAGLVRWLRPEFQNPAARAELPLPPPAAPGGGPAAGATPAPEAPAAVQAKTAARRVPAEAVAWPANLPDQVAAVARVLAEAGTPLALDAVAARFTGRGPWKKRLPEILDTLAALGRARRLGDEWMAP
ncbi:MAG: class I SAM-dependent DNA methyltransferase, partial [Rhodocyclaceae bacterium]|nr:class I SAM-dependent DNA methyltransferase [Rhodocyclaceae bacterium]